MHFYSAVKLNYVIISPVLFYEEKEMSHSKYLQLICNTAATHRA